MRNEGLDCKRYIARCLSRWKGAWEAEAGVQIPGFGFGEGAISLGSVCRIRQEKVVLRLIQNARVEPKVRNCSNPNRGERGRGDGYLGSFDLAEAAKTMPDRTVDVNSAGLAWVFD